MKKKKTKGRVRQFEESGRQGDVAEYREERRDVAKKKKKTKINKVRTVLTVIGIILVAVLGLSVKNIFDLHAEQAELARENKQLVNEKKELKQELKNVNNLEYIEEQARIQLKLVKPGEILYILDDEKKEDGKNND